MITPRRAQTAAAVAAHYNDLDIFYREIWGEHVHHGYWATGRETPARAVEALIELCADRLALAAGQQVCDIGCGYGGSAQFLAQHHAVHVTGLTLSAAQAAQARLRVPAAGSLTILQTDWLANGLPDQTFDRAYAIESSEHMTDKQRFFDEAFRTLKPGGRLAVCAWLATEHPKPWEEKHLLEPICREGRLPGMGTETEYRAFGLSAGFKITGVDDISAQVSRTWRICALRLAKMLFTDSRVIKTLLDPNQPNRIFAVTLFRLIAAYRTRAMRYCLLTYEKPF
jgi:tocopherol O-methyltransferase